MYPKLLYLFLVTLTFFASSIGKEVDRTAVDSVFKLLQEGNDQIRLDDNHRDIIILIGNAGAGKTTLGLLLTTNNDELEAYYDDGAERILIRDSGEKIGTNAVRSQTIFPDLMINPITKVAFYDCPGFRDTRRRNASIEFVNTVFLKKISAHARRMKVVMVVNYSSMRRGESREDFLNLFQSTMGLIKSTDKLRNSFALITTKVETVRSPARTVSVVASFLREFKDSLPEILKTGTDIPRAERLIDALTLSRDGNFPRIYFTRIPSKEGKLSQIPEMQMDRAGIERAIYEGIEYAPVQPTDFGYTFSAEALQFMQSLIERIDEDTAAQMKLLGSAIRRHFQAKVSSATDIRQLLTEIARAKMELRTQITSSTVGAGASMSALNFTRGLLNVAEMNRINVAGVDGVIQKMEEQDKVFQLLSSVSETPIGVDRHKWANPVSKVVDYLQSLEKWIEFLVNFEDKLRTYGVQSDQSPPHSWLHDAGKARTLEFVNQGSWDGKLEKLCEFLAIPFPNQHMEVESTLDESATPRLLNQIMAGAHILRQRQISLSLHTLASKLVESYVSKASILEPNQFREELRGGQRALEILYRDCAQMTNMALAEWVNSTFNRLGISGPESQALIAAIKLHAQVLALIEQDVTLARASTCTPKEALQPVADLTKSTLIGFNYADDIRHHLSSLHRPRRNSPVQNTTSPTMSGNGQMYLSQKNCFVFLDSMGDYFSLKPPSAANQTCTLRAFQTHLNGIISETVDYRNDAIGSSLNQVVMKIIYHFAGKPADFEQVEEFLHNLNLVRQNFTNLEQKSAAMTVEEFLLSLDSLLHELNLKADGLYEALDQVRAQNQVVQLVALASEQASTTVPIHLLRPLTDFLKYIADWYSFLIALDGKLSTFEVQRDKNLYNVAAISNWGSPGKSQGIQITLKNCAEFLKQATRTFPWPFSTSTEMLCEAAATGGKIGYENLLRASKNATLVSRQYSSEGKPLKHLNSVLKRTLKSGPTCTTEGSVLTVRGAYIKISEVLACLKSPISRLVILATLQLYVDVDLNARGLNQGKTFDVLIISPEWTVIQNRGIDLSGPPGQPLPPPPEGTGAAGKPGLPGGNGGNFVGISEKITGGRLTVLTNGGDGGPGQQGASGRAGKDGKFCDQACLLRADWPGCDENKKLYVSITSRYKNNFHSHYGFTNPRDCSKAVYRLYGEPAEAGGAGGDGGKGGLGGNPGMNKVIMVKPENKGEVTQVQNRGPDGPDAQGGSGADGGRQNFVEFEFNDGRRYEKKDFGWKLSRGFKRGGKWTCSHSQRYLGSTESRAASGAAGSTGGNTVNRAAPASSSFAMEQLLPHLVTFRVDSRRIADVIVRSKLLDFTKGLSLNGNIPRSSEPMGLIAEFQELESEAASRTGFRPDLKAEYDHLLQSTHSAILRASQDQRETSTALAYIHTALLGRRRTLSSNLDPAVVVDIRGYLQSEQKKFETLSDLGSDLSRISLIQSATTEYKSKIEGKFEQLHHFINDVIQPEIATIQDGLEKGVEQLVDEIEELKTNELISLHDKIRMLEEKKRELERRNKKSKRMRIIRTVATVASSMLPIGQFMGAAFTAGSGLVEKLMPNVFSQPIQFPPFLTKFQELGQKLQDRTKNVLDIFNLKLEDLNSVIGPQKGPFDKVAKFIGKAQSQLTKLSEGITRIVEKDPISPLLSLVAAEDFVTKANDKIMEGLRKVQNISDRVKPVVAQAENLVNTATDLYRSIRGKGGRVDAVDTSEVDAIRMRIQQLEFQQNQLLGNLMPELSNVRITFDLLMSGLANDSRPAVDITRWRFSTVVKDLKRNFDRFTTGAEGERELDGQVEKLGDALNTLVDLYDRIEGLKDQSALADFIGSINHASLAVNEFTDPALRAATAQLQYTIQANAVLERQKIIIDSFKAWIFPFGPAFVCGLRPLDLRPEKLRTPTGVRELLAEAKQRVSDMLVTAEDARHSIRSVDQFQYEMPFETASPWSPFFTWDNRSFGESIDSLLRGDTVLLFANVESGPTRVDAVKFQSLTLQFTGADEGLTATLATVLRNYTVTMTHKGNSYYRLNGQTYTVTTAETSFSMSFDVGGDGFPKVSNQAYRKVLTGDTALSPYAFWDVILERIDGRRDFSELGRFSGRVNLHLVGRGSFVRGGSLEDELGVECLGNRNTLDGAIMLS